MIVPVYVYRRDDGSTFEIEQRMTADALLSCPTTGRRVERVLQPFAPRYTERGAEHGRGAQRIRPQSWLQPSGPIPGRDCTAPLGSVAVRAV